MLESGLIMLFHMVAIFLLFCRAEASNPGNTLYVTGLSSRVTERDLEEHFSKEGKVIIFRFYFIFCLVIVVLACIGPSILQL